MRMLRDGGSGYKAYIFEESTRRCAIDRKGRGRKEVIYLSYIGGADLARLRPGLIRG